MADEELAQKPVASTSVTYTTSAEPAIASLPVEQSTPDHTTPAPLPTEAPLAEVLGEQAPFDEDEDTDSAFDEGASSTASITSSILRYRTINGRRYHSEQGNAQYWVSNDDQSNEALDINHHVMTLVYGGKLHKAPLSKNMHTAVDIGTGTGIWAIDFADEYPNTSIIGTDLSSIQPTWVPPNLEFQIDDCTQEWTFKENSLDYVHIRLLVGSIVDWGFIFQQAYRCLKPGGYIESHEGSPSIGSDDGSLENTQSMSQWGKIFLEAGEKLARPFSILEDDTQKKMIEAAGFVDIEASDLKIPIGGWSKDTNLKEAGQFFQAAILQDIEGTLTFVASLLGWSQEEITVFAAQYRKEIRDKTIHAYFKQRVVWARKPLGP